ncbi:hypothetical protein CWS35_17735 [Bradyrhizobium sp. SK17]|nr:hypothetical protein CWS35_17735 [Bradyrhizobium sp. SK17]
MRATPHKLRHARACPGHPRLHFLAKKDVDGRDKPGHDECGNGSAICDCPAAIQEGAGHGR